MGDEQVKGNILGFESFCSYDSCKTCFSKLDENFCKKCQKDVEDGKKKDFYVTLYVQDAQNEENIMDIFAFKKDLDINANEDELVEKHLDDLVGKTFMIEYNKPEGEGRFKLVKLHKN